MSEFNLQNSVPITVENGSEIRSAPFSLSNATAVIDPPKQQESIGGMLGRNAKEAAVETVKEVGRIANVIRWPLDRFVWYPLGKAAEYAQGGDVSGQQKPVPPSGKEFLNQPLAPLERIWNNYWKAASGRNTDAPDWYKQLAVGSTIMATEPGIISGVYKGAETLATRVATEEEANAIKNSFEPIKQSLSKIGVDANKLHPDGNIITLSDNSELYLNKNVSAVIRGDEIRIPRWMKVNPAESFTPTDNLPSNHLDNLPLTTKSIIPTPVPPSVTPSIQAEGKAVVSPIAEFIKASTEAMPFSKDMEKGFNELKTQAAGDDLRGQQLLKKVTLLPQDAEALYHHQENPQEPLTPEQQKIYDETIKPLSDKSSELFAKLRNEGIPVPSDGYTPRFIEGKGNTFDRIKSGVQNVGSGVSGLFKKTSGSFKTRVMKGLTDAEGNRQVVSIKKGDVVAWTNKESSSLGKINSQELEDLRAKETAPIEKKMKKLEQEEKILMATKGRKEVAIERLKNIQSELMDLNMQVMDINWKYNPDNLENRVFVDKNGKKWTVGEATTREIEQHTDLTYHKNALLNNLMHYNELRKIDRATQFLETIKNDPEFQKFSMKAEQGNPPTDWKMTSLPQFRGYFLEPRIADTFDYFNKQLYKGRDPIAVFTSLNRFLRTAIFFNPAIHVPNVATHWITARGVSGLSPTTWGRLAKTSGRAIQAVYSQNKDYLDMLDSGVNLMYHGQSGQTLASLMLDKMGQELRSNDKLLLTIKKAVGNINPYNISGKVTWAFNDVATLQSIYEHMEGHSEFPLGFKTAAEYVASKIKESPENINNVVLGHNTSDLAKGSILGGGFTTDKFGETSKQYGMNYKKDPVGISFAPVDAEADRGSLSWKGKGTTSTVYSVPNFKNPLVIKDYENDVMWKDRLHEKYGTEGNGKKLTKALIKDGYDGIVTLLSGQGTVHEVISIVPKNVKNFNSFADADAYRKSQLTAEWEAMKKEGEKKTLKEAIDETAKHIPNYVMPSRILNSRALSEIMTNPNITMFGAYHYGALKSYGEMIKSLLGKVPLKERAEAADKLAMLGLLIFALYPLMDKILQGATGNKEAHLRRAGSTTLPDNINKLMKGQIDFAQVIQSVFTPAVGAKEAVELGFNRDLFTGEKILHSGQEAEGLKDLAVKSIAPLNAIVRITDKKISLNDYLLSMVGVSTSDPNKGKLYSMKDSKVTFQKEFDKMYADNPAKALKAAKKFNDKQIKDLGDVMKEEGLKEVSRSIVKQFIVTSVGVEKKPKKSAGEMLQKQKIQKRKKFSILEEGGL